MSWSTATSKDRIKGVGLKANLGLALAHPNPFERTARYSRPELALD